MNLEQQKLRRTKILATLGPASSSPETLKRMLDAGVDVVRLNLSHGTHDEHRQRIKVIRELSQTSGRQVGILIDLQGPKIRIQKFAQGSIDLVAGEHFTLDINCDEEAGDAKRVGITYPQLIDDIAEGDVLVLADGVIKLRVEQVKESRIECLVLLGGKLSNSKGINKQGGGLSAPALTAKDCRDIEFAATVNADYVAVSFVRNGEDIREARRLLKQSGGEGGIVAKVERAEALDHIDDIVQEAEAIMIARGDLGVEIGDAELPAVQKRLINKARSMNRVAITATQMMESMIEHPIPTRAEVFDVANAVLDGTDAVMLSAETAAGTYPVQTVEAMARVCLEAEKQDKVRKSHHRMDSVFGRIDEAIAMAAMYTANHSGAVAIASWTESGATAMWMSRISSGIPIYALTSKKSTQRRVTLFRGVYPIGFDTIVEGAAAINKAIVDELIERKAVKEGDLLIITKGDLRGEKGGTNVMKIVEVGSHAIES